MVSRSRAVGVHQAGIYVGQILGGFAGYMADSPDHGWRWMFSTCGMIVVIYSIPLIAAVRDPSAPRPKPDFGEGMNYMRVVHAVWQAMEGQSAARVM